MAHLDVAAIGTLVELRVPPLDELALGLGPYLGVLEAGISTLAAASFAPRRLALGMRELTLLAALPGAPLARRLDTVAYTGGMGVQAAVAIAHHLRGLPQVTRVEYDTTAMTGNVLREVQHLLGARLAPPGPRRREYHIF